MTSEEKQSHQEIQFHGAGMAAWFNTSLERDKSLLTLSAGGIGLLLTLASGIANVASIVLYVVAIASFSVSLGAVLAIFQRNRFPIEQALAKGDFSRDPVLSILDSIAVFSFALAVVLTAVLAISTAITSYTNKEQAMPKESKHVEQMQKSFNGLGNLLQVQPSSGAATTSPAAAPTATQPAAAPASGTTSTTSSETGK